MVEYIEIIDACKNLLSLIDSMHGHDDVVGELNRVGLSKPLVKAASDLNKLIHYEKQNA